MSSKICSEPARISPRGRVGGALGGDFLVASLDEFVDGDLALVAGGSMAHGDFVFLRFLLAEDQHVGDFLEGGFSDLRADLFASEIRFDAETCLLKQARRLLGVLVALLTD